MFMCMSLTDQTSVSKLFIWYYNPADIYDDDQSKEKNKNKQTTKKKTVLTEDVLQTTFMNLKQKSFAFTKYFLQTTFRASFLNWFSLSFFFN